MIGCRSLTENEINSIIGEFEKSDHPKKEKHSQRDIIIARIGLCCGYRISEILSLKVKDCFHEDGKPRDIIQVARRNMKGGKVSKKLKKGQKQKVKNVSGRDVPVSDELKGYLSQYYQFLSSLDRNSPEEPLCYSSKTNEALQVKPYIMLLQRTCKKLKIDGKVSTHAFRKTFCNNIHKKLGNDILKTSNAMGHKSIKSTQSYINVNHDEIQSAIKNLYKKEPLDMEMITQVELK